MIVAGNSNYGLAQEIANLFPEAEFHSRSVNKCDLVTDDGRSKFATDALNHEIIILCSALWKFNQTILLDEVFKTCQKNNKRPLIICIGSTTDRVKNGKVWLYNAEKKALRDYCNTLSINGVWGNGPRVTLISFGSLSNVQEKHPDRICMSISEAASYVKFIVEQPKHLHINEISIDPLQ